MPPYSSAKATALGISLSSLMRPVMSMTGVMSRATASASASDIPSQRVGAMVSPEPVNPVRAVTWSGSISTTAPHAFGSRWRAEVTHRNTIPVSRPASISGIRRRRSTGHVSSITTSTAGDGQPLRAAARLEQPVDEPERVVRGRGQLRSAERAGVRQPLEERPVGEPALADEGDDGQIGRAVHRRRLHDDRAGEGAGRGQRAGEADPALLEQVDRQRHVVEEAEAAGDLLEVAAQVAGAAARHLDRRARRQFGGADAQAQEVLVLGCSLPQPVGEAAHEATELTGSRELAEAAADLLDALVLEVLDLLGDERHRARRAPP